VAPRERLRYLWRLAATGLAFLAMGGGGLFLALAVIPIATLGTRDPQVRTRRARRIIRASFHLYVHTLRLTGVIRLEVIGEERLLSCRGNLIIANHPTLLDVVLIMSLVPDARCVVKHELWRNPFLALIVRAAGYIRNDQEPERFIEACRGALAAGSNLIIFPEGTRSVPGRPVHFQRGFAHIATLTGASLQLVTITCDPITLFKGQPWYVIPECPPTFRIEINERLETVRFLGAGPRPLGARRLVSQLESYYGRKLRHG
jgi:1-acyl-sn-glycerol-3-phosphate acyltransferase